MKTALTITWLAKGMAHVLALFLGFMLAYEARLDPPLIWWFDLSSSLRVLGWGVIFAVIGGGVEAVFQTERGAWRFASARDVVGLARNVTLTTALFLLVRNLHT
jgi:FlaA1/EpsC-like NDP-sugar epimerase